jgi:DNA (cytosine-5)-methyltransferase 1
MNELRTMHLFAGIGGGLLADSIIGHIPIIAVEWDKYACRVLRERAADGWFPELSVWEGDVRLFDPSEYAGRVDCIHAGFPCQDISVAGKQAGLGEGTRSGLYREVLRIAGVVRPRYLFLENVSAILSNGLGCVLGDLAAMGYDCRWLCIRASDVGAPHGRDRWFAIAELCYPNSDSKPTVSVDDEASKLCNVGNAEHDGQLAAEVAGSIAAGNDSNTTGAQQACEPARPGEQHAELAYTNGTQCEGNKCTERSKQEHSNISSGGWWETESLVGRVADGIPNRVGMLKGLGNAQVPLQAAAAWRILTHNV